ncbi:hypothetical protein REK76_29355 (plasmid) [Nocardia farcinica]|uniref:hypothetical protein n=1 Tax=Nocardia farcinica TaxID=37329 RepID=UPI0018938CF6|nr:hypothetical protein [Nocardia farcinica]MBF6284494.1 hypothetical protein [Nocardia farcinica]
MSDIPADGIRAILAQVARVQEAHRRGDTATALALHQELTARYGLTTIAEVMSARDELEKLGIEARLLALFGGDVLYGREE